jgi:uncharacterized Ntn-hydrolase superfamily protein
MKINHDELCATYSIVARDPATGNIGIAVQTHQVAVGRLVPWLLPGIGAVVTQSLVNVSLGLIGLNLLKNSVAAPQVVQSLIASDVQAERRQFACVDSEGRSAAFTGQGCIREADHALGDGFAVQANMMSRKTVIRAMQRAYEKTKGDLATRMLAALVAAQAEDGDIRGMQSAALKIVSGQRDVPEWATIYDLRVDEHRNPLDELTRLVTIRRAELVDAEGHELLQTGNVAAALARWKTARDQAPDQVELAFWQAIRLADQKPDGQAVSLAARILALVLEKDYQRREKWLELIRRLAECGLIERPGAAEELLAALKGTT